MEPRNEEEAQAFEMAERFFKNDYKDRGMMKWQGFYLSDQIENVEKDKQKIKAEMEQEQIPSMREEEISEVLFNAYRNHKSVEYQLKGMTVDGLFPQIVSGAVKGYAEEDVYIGNTSIPMEQINWCQIK